MGTFSVVVDAVCAQASRFIEVEALVGTGTTHTLLPTDVLRALGVQPVERIAFQLADESVVEYEIGEVRIRLDGRERTTMVVFGPTGRHVVVGGHDTRAIQHGY